MNAFLMRIVRTLAEMEQGLRPVSALDGIASPLAARRIRKVVHSARKAGTWTSGRRRTSPPQVVSASSSQPTAGVTEGVVVLAFEDRTRPYCIRLERMGEDWRVVELAPPDAGLRAAVTQASRTGILPGSSTSRPQPAREVTPEVDPAAEDDGGPSAHGSPDGPEGGGPDGPQRTG